MGLQENTTSKGKPDNEHYR